MATFSSERNRVSEVVSEDISKVVNEKAISKVVNKKVISKVVNEDISKAKKTPKIINNERKKKVKENCVSFIQCYIPIITLFVICIAYYNTSLLGPNTFSKNGIGDISVRDFASDLNTMMCQVYDVSPVASADLYLVPGRAKITPNKWNTLIRRNSTLFPSSYNRDNSFYLLEDSNIKANACRFRENFDPHVQVDILLFKGKESWQDWKGEKCDDCYLKRQTLPNKFCEEGGEAVLNYRVKDRDTYYVAVTKRKRYQNSYIHVSATLVIMQTTFDTKNALKKCYSSTNCVFNLTYSSDVDVVVKFDDESTINEFTTNCTRRVMFWVGVFGILPACIAVIMLFICCMPWGVECRKKKRRPNKEAASTSDRANILKNEMQPARTNECAGSIQVV